MSWSWILSLGMLKTLPGCRGDMKRQESVKPGKALVTAQEENRVLKLGVSSFVTANPWKFLQLVCQWHVLNSLNGYAFYMLHHNTVHNIITVDSDNFIYTNYHSYTHLKLQKLRKSVGSMMDNDGTVTSTLFVHQPQEACSVSAASGTSKPG